MKTKAYNRFKQRCDYYHTDLELCDILISNFKSIPDSADRLFTALGSDSIAHPRLNQLNTKRTRDVRGGHLKRTITSSFIKDLYEDFVDFVSETMLRAAQKGVNPGRFIGDANIDISAKELLSVGNWDNAVELVSRKLFRSFENEKKTIEIIRKASKRLGLSVAQPDIDDALPYLEARHLLVHQDGKADSDYTKRFPSVPVKFGKIVLDRSFAQKAHYNVDKLASSIDKAVLVADMVLPEHTCP